MFVRRCAEFAFVAFVAVFAATFADEARAQTVEILALGASNTNGHGLMSSAQAWPARLEAMLRARGYDARVRVDAIDGQTSAQILDRAKSDIPAGTRVVVFDSGGDNDRIRGTASQTEANAAQIAAVIRAAGAVPIRAPYRSVAGTQHADNPNYQPDQIHLTAASHQRVAAALLPTVIAAIKRRR